MGYTHYWTAPTELDAATFATFADFADDVRQVILACPPGLLGDADGTVRRPVANAQLVAMNGLDRRPSAAEIADIIAFLDDYGVIVKYESTVEKLYRRGVHCDAGHEPLVLSRVSDGRGDSTKTAQKPYDIAVTATLILLAAHFPEGVRLRSDGFAEEWLAGLRLAQHATGKDYLIVPPEIRRVIPFYRERGDEKNVADLLANGFRGQPVIRTRGDDAPLPLLALTA